MIKQLLKSLREYKRDSILAPVIVIFEVILEVAVPILMGMIVDHGIAASNMPYVFKMGGLLIVLTILSLMFGVFAGKYAASASAGFAKNLRHDMYYNVQNFAFSNIERFSTASLITRMTTDVTNVQMAYQMAIRILVRSPAMFLFAMIMSFYINAKLALVFLVASLLLGFGLYFIARHAHPFFVRVFHRYDDLNTVVQENIRGIRLVKSFVREPFEVKKFKNDSSAIYKDFVTAEKILAFNSPMMQFCIYTCMLLISWFGAHLITAGTMTTGELISIFSYAMQILSSLMMASMVVVLVVISKSSAERITEVITEDSNLKNGSAPVYEVKDGSVAFEHVNFSYANDEKKLCLKDIHLQMHSGETIGIIGGTGSAKSSFVNLIPRLYDVTSGSVKVGGLDVRSYDLETLRSQVAVVLQKNVLFSGTIKENLRWGNKNASDEELMHACKLAQADEFIQTFPQGYDTYIEQGGSNVSGGQKQRLCIARALLKKPKILILDDSTSAVDTKTDALIRKAFLEEIPDTTKIIIAQRISSIENADRIIVLEDGRINAIGTHEELLKSNAIYQEVYESQTKGALSDAE